MVALDNVYYLVVLIGLVATVAAGYGLGKFRQEKIGQKNALQVEVEGEQGKLIGALRGNYNDLEGKYNLLTKQHNQLRIDHEELKADFNRIKDIPLEQIASEHQVIGKALVQLAANDEKISQVLEKSAATLERATQNTDKVLGIIESRKAVVIDPATLMALEERRATKKKPT